MRLRLSVQRNELPASNILWNVPATNSPQAYTVARLLEDVNQVLPLEAEQWGLEDYIVEVGGFECLHFSPILQTLKDDDVVSIRPLLTAEVRSRTLCGRNQISADGRRLVDGIPFGRPYLRQPNRPNVRIPSRKRRRIEEDTDLGAEETEAETVGLITANGEPQEQADGSAYPAANYAPGRPSSQGSTKKVQFLQDEEMLDESEDDGDFAPSDEDDDSDASTPSHSDTKSDNASSVTNSSDSSDVSSSSDSDSDSSSNDSENELPDSSTQTFTPPVTLTEKTLEKRSVPPGMGARVTKIRNSRRAMSKKLREFKEAGHLPPNATLEDYREYMGYPKSDITSPEKFTGAQEGKRKRLEEDVGEDIRNEAIIRDEAIVRAEAVVRDEAIKLARTELELRKQKMLAEFEEATLQAETPKPDNVHVRGSNVAIPRPDTPPEIMSSKRPTKRLRPDTAAIGRILAHQTRTLVKKPAKAKQPVIETLPEPEGASEPDFWKSRVNLSAFECWEEDHELSAPPFPFQQHWDPASQLMRDGNKKKAKKNKKKPPPISESDEEEENIILDYDDSPITAKEDSDPTAAIESQLKQDVQVAAKSDLPALPEDVESLPILQTTNIQVGAIIAFKLWVIDPKTVCPEITNYKTAVVEKEGDSGGGAGQFKLKLAQRDVPKADERKVDGEGNRIRSTRDDFRMGGADEEEEEDSSIWEGTFAELVEPKLVMAAE